MNIKSLNTGVLTGTNMWLIDLKLRLQELQKDGEAKVK